MRLAAGLDRVSVRLGGSLILDEVSLHVAPGEFVSLLGPSGSGKTTSLNVLAGFIDPFDGDVSLDDERVNGVPPAKRDVGFVFQNYALFPHMSVAENIAFPLRLRGIDRRQRDDAIARSLELVQLAGMGPRSVTSLSGGQQQRVALARALCFNPRVLLLDEPLAALDKQLRNTMQIELARIQREVGVTTIAVTHDQVEALTMADRVVIMRDGRVEQVGTPEEVYRRPATLFVAGFLGEANVMPIGAGGALAGLGVRLPGHRAGIAVIRPEDVSVVASEHGGDAAVGIVESTYFQGTQYRVLVRLEGSSEPIVAFLEAAPTAPQPGETVKVEVDPSRVHVIDETEPSVAVAPAPAVEAAW
jgi:putative spermidine/putrescine transport system ATP-binding protein